MTLTTREYLHQHFGPKDRRWIESLSDERCWEIANKVGLGYADMLPDVPGEYPNWR